ncbi:chromosome partitioning protein ParB [Xenophilus aerolatus]|nr:chromosome partitioning protein ParB [Xenophilus aerolatus]
MNDLDALDLSGLAQFRPSDFLAAGAGVSDPSAAVHVDLSVIDFDPAQPRRSFKRESLDELSESIRQHGVLEPVSLRRHPERGERYIVNRGERRVRAARQAALTTVPAFLDDRMDPFAQAAENLHREDMSALDLALFIAEREREGISRSEIARRLAKPRSFITEAAALNEASSELLEAVRDGRVSEDVRTLYRLVSVGRQEPAVVRELLGRGDPIYRANVEALISQARGRAPVAPTDAGATSVPVRSGGRTVLVVEHEGKRGSLRMKAQDSDLAEVRFGDGTRSAVPLAALRLVCWATEEAK